MYSTYLCDLKQNTCKLSCESSPIYFDLYSGPPELWNSVMPKDNIKRKIVHFYCTIVSEKINRVSLAWSSNLPWHQNWQTCVLWYCQSNIIQCQSVLHCSCFFQLPPVQEKGGNYVWFVPFNLCFIKKGVILLSDDAMMVIAIFFFTVLWLALCNGEHTVVNLECLFFHKHMRVLWLIGCTVIWFWQS